MAAASVVPDLTRQEWLLVRGISSLFERAFQLKKVRLSLGATPFLQS
jgi:hypothetical protein